MAEGDLASRLDRRSRFASLRCHGVAAVGLAGVCVAVLWPAVSRGRGRVLVGTGDSSVFIWSWWAMLDALGRGANPFDANELFYPVGADLAMTTTAPFVALVTAPIRAAWGPSAQVNASQLLGAWVAAFGTYLLLHHLTRHRVVAALGGVAFAFAPFRFVHLTDHLNLVHTGFLPIGALCLLRLLDRPTRARGVVLGAVLAAAFLTDPQVAVLTAVAVTPVAVLRRADVVRARRQLAWSVGVWVVGSSPLLVPMLLALAAGEGNAVDPAAMVEFSADPSRWVVPPSTHRVFGGLARAALGRPPDEGIAYPGLMVLVLAGSAAWLVPRQQRRPWVWVVIVGGVLALGPFVSFRQEYIPIPLPFLAVRLVPGLNSLRVPGRFVVVGLLGLVVLACLALTEVLARLPDRRRVVIGGFALVMAVDLWPTDLVTRSSAAPVPYAAIAAHPGNGAVLEVPLQWSTGEQVIGYAGGNVSIFMAYGAVHRRALVNGSVSRYPDDRLARLLAVPVYRQLLALQGEPGVTDPATFDAQDLAALGIGYVVYHRDIPIRPVLDHIRGLDLPVLADDGTVIVWEVPPAR